ncbi:reverse transcriptase domain-containing protein [Eggerthella sinensis]|uniref:reverse transcriptase domain-containing protein n=1 Tax=Eggerthella sinensis TaxID=242230 RepID=UPI0022E4288A|nr:reverse transcriptase domain-containing protein [Eggerthella sinensis]
MKPLHAVIPDLDKLAEQLGVSTKKLLFFSEISFRRKYVRFGIPKKNGEIRLIEAPKTSLKVMQKLLANLLSPYYCAPRCVHGYVGNRSIISGASSHLKRDLCGKVIPDKTKHRAYVSLDIKDFFPSINSKRIYGLLVGKHLNLSRDVAFCIANLCVGEKGLAQGSPASPLLSNMICLTMDRSLTEYAKKKGLFYTRYADDITFSTSNRKLFRNIFFEDGIFSVPAELRTIIETHKGIPSFRLNDEKTHYRLENERQMITGIVVNSKLNLRREYYRQLRSCLHTWISKGKTEAARKYYKKSNVDDEDSNSLEMRLYGKLNHYKQIAEANRSRCTPLEKLGSMFNQICEGSKFPIHKPEDSLFLIKAFPLRDDGEGSYKEGTGFFLQDVGIVTSRHTFDDYSFDGAPLKIEITSMKTGASISQDIKVAQRKQHLHYDCVKLEFCQEDIDRAFPGVAPLPITSFTEGELPVTSGDELTAFDWTIASDPDLDLREWQCVEIIAHCTKPSRGNQFGRMARVKDANFYKGMSGGPILNDIGEVVGIVQSGIDREAPFANRTESKLLFLDRLDDIPYGICPKT